MPAVTNNQCIKQSLQLLLQSAKEGKTQLPDFQRSWVWNDEQIRSLLASVSLSYPIGAVMMLETGNPAVSFKHRLLEGVTRKEPQKPDQLLLDGQQRMTSLFQVLLSEKPVKTKDVRGKEIHRWYYIDIAKALNPNSDREEVIVGLPEEKIKRNLRGEILADYSTTEKECAAEVFPLQLVFDILGQNKWMQTYLQLDANMGERLTRWTNFLQEVIQSFQHYQVPIILLGKETPREAVCQVFEKVNTGGVSLTVFELITATYAADEFNLREDWAKREKKLKQLAVLGNVENTDFLQAVTLLATCDRHNQGAAISCTRKDILKLTLDEYKLWADAVTEGFEKAAKLLHTQKIFTAKDLPYQPQLTALAAIFAALGDRSMSDPVRAKLARWYWCGVFGELYSSAIESRLAKDLPQVLHWIDGDSEPDTIKDANFAPNRLIRLYSRRSAAYKGLSALLLRDKGCDFLTGYEIDTAMYFDESIDIHHIFPRHWCEKNGIKADLYDSVVNKTPLSSRTNKIIGGNAPSVYLSKLQTSAAITEERMDEIVRSHVIDVAALRLDNFEAFFQARQKALLCRIEKAMGKSLITDASVESEDIELFDFDEADNEIL
jgi:hypothetical protein